MEVLPNVEALNSRGQSRTAAERAPFKIGRATTHALPTKEDSLIAVQPSRAWAYKSQISAGEQGLDNESIFSLKSQCLRRGRMSANNEKSIFFQEFIVIYCALLSSHAETRPQARGFAAGLIERNSTPDC